MNKNKFRCILQTEASYLSKIYNGKLPFPGPSVKAGINSIVQDHITLFLHTNPFVRYRSLFDICVS